MEFFLVSLQLECKTLFKEKKLYHVTQIETLKYMTLKHVTWGLESFFFETSMNKLPSSKIQFFTPNPSYSRYQLPLSIPLKKKKLLSMAKKINK